MIRKISSRQLAQLLVIVLSAWSLKWFYSTASVDQLRWILWPTTKLVALITGAQFTFESPAGYMNSEHTFLIAASCAGVNFLITAFVMLGLREMWRDRNEKTSWYFIPIAAVLAFVTTIVTNTVRISLALQMLGPQKSNRWLNAEELHRLEGIVIYFEFLLLLFVAVEEFDRRQRRVSSSRHLRLWRRFTFPLAIYYAMTLGIPLANGAFRERGFWEHSAFVVVIPLLLMAPIVLFGLALRNRCGTHASGVPARGTRAYPLHCDHGAGLRTHRCSRSRSTNSAGKGPASLAAMFDST